MWELVVLLLGVGVLIMLIHRNHLNYKLKNKKDEK